MDKGSVLRDYHEVGTSKMAARPHMRPAYQSKKRRIRNSND
jgi:hypothetical protein